MATGLIGLSEISLLEVAGTTTGTTLSYTCPATGVAYAVVTVVAAVSCYATGNDSARAKAGMVRVILKCTTNAIPISRGTDSCTYTVILAPGQTWSEFCEVVVGVIAQGGGAVASLRASVLEVI